MIRQAKHLNTWSNLNYLLQKVDITSQKHQVRFAADEEGISIISRLLYTGQYFMCSKSASWICCPNPGISCRNGKAMHL